MADVTQRMLALLAVLQTGREFPGDELARRLDVHPRTLRRDVDKLRGYGYPVQTRPGPGGFYRLAAGTAMPPLLLEDDEAVAVLVALATLSAAGEGAGGEAGAGSLDDAATRAYGKVDQYLPRRLRPRAAQLRGSIESSTPVAPGTSAGAIGLLAGAIHDADPVAFTYREVERRAEPYRLLHHQVRWYLLAWDLVRDGWRVYRVDRIGELRRAGPAFTPRPLPAGNGLEYLRQGMHKERHRVVLTVEAPLAAVADALRFEDAELASLTPGRTRAVLWLDTWQWLLTGFAFLDADFTVDEPASFRQALTGFGERLIHSHPSI
jgi:predicted DNA-binding transcriptional regulator YafY